MSRQMSSTILIFCIALILFAVVGALSSPKVEIDIQKFGMQKIQFIERDKGEEIDGFMLRVMKLAEMTPNIWIIKGKLGIFGSGRAEMIMPANIQWLPNEFGEVSAAIIWWWEREAEMERK